MIFGIIGILLLTGALLGKISWGWGVLGAIFLYLPATRFWTKYKAASNAILAHHTFNLLSESDRKKVLIAVSAIMSNAKYPSQDSEQELNSMTPEQRYGFIALGIARIGIVPKIGGGWYEIHNPYAEILGAHREIAFVKYQIRLRYGVDVNFDDVVTTTAQRSSLVAQDFAAAQHSKQHNGTSVPQDYPAAVRPAAAWPTCDEKSTPKNNKETMDSLCKSAEQGDVEEKVRLGDMYSGSDGFEKNDENDELAGYWYRKAAEQGDSTGQWKLGDMYREGRGVEQDDEQAAYWFRKAAEQQDDKGQLRLGDMYREGRGVEQNYEQAMHWYLKATESGHIGFRQLGNMYKEGLGVDKDVGKAKYWYGQEPHWNGYSG